MPISSLLERHVDANMPSELKEGASVPDSWNGPASEWEAIRQEAVAAIRAEYVKGFAIDVATNGMRPSEILSGQIAPGRRQNIFSGRVVSAAPPSTLSEAQRIRGQRVKVAAAQRLLNLGIAATDIDQISTGNYTGYPEVAERILNQTESQISTYDATVKVAVQADGAKPIINVIVPFSALGKTYVVGRQQVTHEELYGVDGGPPSGLLHWAQSMEAQCRGGRRLSSIGFATWPVFVTEEETVKN